MDDYLQQVFDKYQHMDVAFMSLSHDNFKDFILLDLWLAIKGTIRQRIERLEERSGDD